MKKVDLNGNKTYLNHSLAIVHQRNNVLSIQTCFDIIISMVTVVKVQCDRYLWMTLFRLHVLPCMALCCTCCEAPLYQQQRSDLHIEHVVNHYLHTGGEATCIILIFTRLVCVRGDRMSVSKIILERQRVVYSTRLFHAQWQRG